MYLFPYPALHDALIYQCSDVLHLLEWKYIPNLNVLTWQHAWFHLMIFGYDKDDNRTFSSRRIRL